MNKKVLPLSIALALSTTIGLSACAPANNNAETSSQSQTQQVKNTGLEGAKKALQKNIDILFIKGSIDADYSKKIDDIFVKVTGQDRYKEIQNKADFSNPKAFMPGLTDAEIDKILPKIEKLNPMFPMYDYRGITKQEQLFANIAQIVSVNAIQSVSTDKKPEVTIADDAVKINGDTAVIDQSKINIKVDGKELLSNSKSMATSDSNLYFVDGAWKYKATDYINMLLESMKNVDVPSTPIDLTESEAATESNGPDAPVSTESTTTVTESAAPRN